jgi:hypothetical protein
MSAQQLQALQDALGCLPPYAPQTLLRVYRQMRRAQDVTYPHIDVICDAPDATPLPAVLMTAMQEADSYIAAVQLLNGKFKNLKPIPITIQNPGFGL